MQIVSQFARNATKETICSKCQNLFSGKNKKYMCISKCRLLILLYSMLSIYNRNSFILFAICCHLLVVFLYSHLSVNLNAFLNSCFSRGKTLLSFHFLWFVVRLISLSRRIEYFRVSGSLDCSFVINCSARLHFCNKLFDCTF